MARFEALRASVREAVEAAPSMVDDECAKRIAQTAAMVTGALDNLENAQTTERVTNRTPAVRRCIDRLTRELACDGAEGWAARVTPVREALARADAAFATVEATAKEARERIAAALREAA